MQLLSAIKYQIDQLVLHLVEVGLANDQQVCFQKSHGGSLSEITFPGADHVAGMLKDKYYGEIYEHVARERAYNLKMMDGAMIQMMYMFAGVHLERHRLVFLPSPHLEEFQNSPEIYLEDDMYADVVAKEIVPFPIRFDFDVREETYKELEHPKSHLTLGQYRNCRIPVTGPLTPFHFIQFILRSFYNTAHNKCADKLPTFSDALDETIAVGEKRVIHIQIPQGVAR